MTERDLTRSLARLYWLGGIYAAIGFVSYVSVVDAHEATGFLLGALASLGNFWLFAWLARAITPGQWSRQPWAMALYAIRLLLLFLLAYVIVNLLGVSPLAVILGLLVSAAAVLTYLVAEIIQSLLRHKTTR
ncbi:MAG: ATP synthase subunit I [Bryobacteraceae bacterium]